MATQHKWQVGDLCRAVYNNVGEGLIYRVTKVVARTVRGSPASQNGPTDYYILTVKPVYGIMASVENRKTRTMDGCYCSHVSIMDMGLEYLKFGNFIRDEAIRLGADLTQPAQESAQSE